MNIPESTVTIKGQTTMPVEVREMLHIKGIAKIAWISIRPGEISVIAKDDLSKNTDFVDKLYGIIEDDSYDSLEELKKYKKEDLELEKRGIEN